MNENFLESAILLDHRVLGRRLHPLCLRHILYFHACGLAFTQLFEEGGAGDLADEGVPREHFEAAVWVCSNRGPTCVPVPGSKADRVRARWVRASRRKCGAPHLLQREFNSFMGYLLDHLSPPETLKVSDYEAKFDPGAPWPMSLATAMLSETNLTYDQVWYEIPLGELLWMAAAIGEMNETQQIVDDPELAAFLAKVQAGGGNISKGGDGDG